jgi:hypothetical protein
MVETGAAVAAVVAMREKPSTPKHLRDDIETSGGRW